MLEITTRAVIYKNIEYNQINLNCSGFRVSQPEFSKNLTPTLLTESNDIIQLNQTYVWTAIFYLVSV